jgi:hypothetical protein
LQLREERRQQMPKLLDASWDAPFSRKNIVSQKCPP